MKVKESYFSGLSEQIINKAKWSRDKFVVFNHEAGTGKSTRTHQIIGGMTKKQSHRVLYVQRFLKDDELNNTVKAINRNAGRKVAISITGKDTEKGKSTEVFERSQVICITHQMYIQVCKGEHQHLIKDRDILIIDEFPDLLEKINISNYEIGLLWTECRKRNVPAIEEWAILLRDLIDGGNVANNVMRFTDFSDGKDQHYEPMIKSAINKLDDKNSKIYKGILKESLQLTKNGGFLFEEGFHTFNDNRQFVLLKNNIILDANAAFDYRYKLYGKFDLHEKEKMYDYAKDTLHHINVKTTKNALKKFEKFVQEALKEIQLEGKKGILFVTEKANVDKLEKEIVQYFSDYGNNLSEIEGNLKIKIKIDYFGNLIGVNHYHDYDAVVLLKTPHYDYLTYALTYQYYTRLTGQPVENVELFKHEIVEAIRKSTVAGEMYQAIKRINRDNSRRADIYVFADFQEAIDMVVEQLPNIQYNKKDLEEKQNTGRHYDKTKREKSTKSEKARIILLEAKKSGIEMMQKLELRNLLEIKSRGNLTKILDKLEAFFKEHGISQTGQQIWFHDNLKDCEFNKLCESA